MERDPGTGLPNPPKGKPFVMDLPDPPTHNPDPTYRTRLLQAHNDAVKEFMARRSCLMKSRAEVIADMKAFKQIADESRAALVKDGAVLKGKARTRRRRGGKKTRKSRK